MGRFLCIRGNNRSDEAIIVRIQEESNVSTVALADVGKEEP